MKMLAEDIAAGKGDLKLRQADYSRFEIGKNIAVSPGKVVGPQRRRRDHPVRADRPKRC